MIMHIMNYTMVHIYSWNVYHKIAHLIMINDMNNSMLSQSMPSPSTLESTPLISPLSGIGRLARSHYHK